jgi:hypothetical protein
MQRSQRYGKTFTPVNLLASLGGQHLGLKFDRPGVQPIGDETWKYDTNGYLTEVYNVFKLQTKNSVLPLRVDPRGGFDSTYGIGVTTYNRQHNSFFTKGQDEQDRFANFTQRTNPFDLTFDPFVNSYEKTVSLPDGELTSQRGEFDTKTKQTPNLLSSEGRTAGFGNDISDYESISYGTIQKIQDKDASNYKGDFRNLKTQVARGVDSNGNAIPAADDYVQNNLRRTYGFGETFKTNAQRITNDRLDTIGMSGVGSPEQDDIVKLVFKTNSSNLCQFRGTVSGITETFSPSWNPEKPNGRADKMYMMTEFERTLSFNFKAVAYSRMELIPMWEKLKQLATFTMPFYGDSFGYRGRPLEFTLGDLWKNHTSLLTSLSYTMSDETAWETDKNYTIPKLVDISIGLTLVGDSIHSENSTPNLYDYGV